MTLIDGECHQTLTSTSSDTNSWQPRFSMVANLDVLFPARLRGRLQHDAMVPKTFQNKVMSLMEVYSSQLRLQESAGPYDHDVNITFYQSLAADHYPCPACVIE
jgi:hypothetical protein